MNKPLIPSRLPNSQRGSGLVCDAEGVSLGAVALVQTPPNGGAPHGCRVRSPAELERILGAAFGNQSAQAIGRVHRGLSRAAKSLDVGDLGRASLEVALLGLPEPTANGLAKLAALADLEKTGDAWEDQPRVPAGQAGGGQWTADADSGGAAVVQPTSPIPKLTTPRNRRRPPTSPHRS